MIYVINYFFAVKFERGLLYYYLRADTGRKRSNIVRCLSPGLVLQPITNNLQVIVVEINFHMVFAELTLTSFNMSKK